MLTYFSGCRYYDKWLSLFKAKIKHQQALKVKQNEYRAF
jgi:hypothetical protein